jgi:hypothetical protein
MADAGSSDRGTTEEGGAMNLLLGAGEVVLWCMAVVIGLAVVAVGALHAWDKWTGWQWSQRMKRRGL